MSALPKLCSSLGAADELWKTKYKGYDLTSNSKNGEVKLYEGGKLLKTYKSMEEAKRDLDSGGP